MKTDGFSVVVALLVLAAGACDRPPVEPAVTVPPRAADPLLHMPPPTSPCCAVDTIVAARAGSGATDCGFVPLGGDRVPMRDCVDAAMAEGRAVHAGWQRQGTDSEVRMYVAGHDGSFSLFDYDGDPSGGGGACPRLAEMPCDRPLLHEDEAPGVEDVFRCRTTRALERCTHD